MELIPWQLHHWTAHSSGAPEFTPVFRGVRVTRSVVLCVCFVDRCLSFRIFSFSHGVVCSSSIYGFWLSRWYLQNHPTLHELNLENYDLLYFLFNHVCFATFWRWTHFLLATRRHLNFKPPIETKQNSTFWQTSVFDVLLYSYFSWFMTYHCVCN
jgi:hypothetical protein